MFHRERRGGKLGKREGSRKRDWNEHFTGRALPNAGSSSEHGLSKPVSGPKDALQYDLNFCGSTARRERRYIKESNQIPVSKKISRKY